MQLRKSLNKLGQEEMVGFVLVVVLVAVIFMVFLGIFVRQKGDVRDESTEISQFLDSAIDFTTSCSTDGFDYHRHDVGELIAKCSLNGGQLCDSGERACEVLRNTLKGLAEAGWNFDRESPNKGYIIEVTRADASAVINQIIGGVGAGCSSYLKSEKPVFTPTAPARISFRLCLN